MNDRNEITFGKYKGKKLTNVPGEYLLWLYENNKCNNELKNYIIDNLDVIKKDIYIHKNCDAT